MRMHVNAARALLLGGAAALALSGCTRDRPAPTPGIAPILATFTVTPSSVTAGTPTTVAWTWTYANTPTPVPTCSIDNGVGTVTSGTATSVTLSADEVFTLTCKNSEGQDSAEETITAEPAGSFSIGGTVSGLLGNGLVLQNNGGDDLPVALGASTFSFATDVADHAPYLVTVKDQPAGQLCVVTGGAGTISGANVTDVLVACGAAALYPQHGGAWNGYVKGSSIVDATDVACNAATDTACLHAGEVRFVEASGKSSCAGLTASDALGAFEWVCDDSTGTARLISTGLKRGKNLADLIDFATPGWKANSVSVYDGATLHSTSAATPWTTNPVVVSNAGGTLGAAGTIYVVTDDALVQGYTITASSIGVVAEAGVIVDGPGAGSTSVVVKADASSGGAKDFLWIEGSMSAPGDSAAISLTNVRFSTLRNVQASGANSSLGLGVGIFLSGSSRNRLANVTALGNLRSQIKLYSSSYNTLSDVIVSTAPSVQGIELSSSNHNRLSRIRGSNVWAAVYMNSSHFNLLSDVVASNAVNAVDLGSSNWNILSGATCTNASGYGVALYGSLNNRLAGITVSGGASGGFLLSGSDSNVLSDVTVTNSGHGISLLWSSRKNTLAGIALANNDEGVRLASSSANNTFVDVAAANNGHGVYLDTASNNTFAGLLEVGNNAIADCYVNGGTNPGLVNATCANEGSSSATLSTGISLASSFDGKVSADDAANVSDVDGAASYADIADWTAFENPFRGWGMDGSAFPNADQRGRCTAGTCRIWDWSLTATDSVLRGASTSIPTGSDTLTHTWSDATTATFLAHAVEIAGDGVGDEDTLCESGELCLYTPNVGSYQGHGELTDAGTFVDGVVAGVTLRRYGTNGR